MTTAYKMRALDIINKAQQTSAPVMVQFGVTWQEDGVVDHDALILKKAPASIINALKDEGYSLSLSEHGLSVDKYF